LDLKIITPTPIFAGKIVPPEKLYEAAKDKAGSRFGSLNPILYNGVS
jgi:hypothetical protein